jgi:tape measure domain-containing protein
MTGVKIRVRADSTQARRDLQRLERSVASIEKTTSNVTRGFQKLAIGITAAFTGVALTRGLSGAADSITNLENKLALVVGRGAELRTTLRSLYTISAGARLPIATATDAFNRFGLALQDSGKSTEEILRVTNAVLQSATLSGATAASANGAIMQLGQGLASGTLRGEELNSVLEGMPRLARAIAVGMGVPFGELKALAADGKLNAEAVFAAIASEAANINSEFDGLEATISGLSSVLKDEFTRALSAFDKEIKFSENLGKVIIAATDGLRYFADNLSFWSTIYRARLNSITNDFIFFADDIKNLFTDNFDIDLSPVIDSISDISSSVAELAIGAGNTISFTVQALDLGQFIPSLDTVKSTLGNFIKTIEGWFAWLYDRVIGNSWWSDIFWKGENQIGGPKFKKALDFVKTTLATWTENIGKAFSDLYTTVSNKWAEILHLLTTTEIPQPGGLSSFEPNAFGRGLEYAAEKAGELKTALADALSTRELVGSFEEGFLNLEYELTPLGKFLDMISEAGTGIEVYLSDNFGNIIDKLYEVWESGGSSILRAASPVVAAVGTAGIAIGDAIASGELIATGFINKMINDAEVLGGAIAVALITKAALGMSLKTLFLSAGALVFSGDILDSAATQASLRSLARGIGAFIGSFFEEGGADDIGQAFIRGLRDSIRAIGEGLTEGFDGSALDSELGNELVGAIAALITIAAVSGGLKLVLFKAGAAIVAGLFTRTVSLASLAVSALSPIIGSALASVATTPLVARASDAAGRTIGIAMRTGLLAGLVGGLSLGIGSALDTATNGIVDRVDRLFSGRSVNEQQARNARRVLDLMGEGESGIRAIAQLIDNGVVSSEELSLLGEENLATLKSALDLLEPTILDGISGFGIFESSLEELAKSIDAASAQITSGAQQRTIAVTPSNNPLPVDAFATGGAVNGAGGPTDDKIPAMLSNGEFVMKASAVDKLGVGFMNRINAGMAPEGFANGGLAGQLDQIDSQIAETQQEQFEAMSRNLPSRVSVAIATLSNLHAERSRLVERMADDESGGFDPSSAFAGTTSSEISGSGSENDPEEEDDAKTLAETFAEGFKEDFKSGLSQFLKTGDLKEFTLGLLDSFTSKVIDSFVEGFTESIFEGLELDSMFEGLFQGVQDWGATLGEGTVGATEGGIFGIDFSGLFEGISSFFSGIFEGFGGGGGSGGGFLSSVMGLFGGGSFLGLNDGGLVKPLNTSRTDIDSVPAMLTPGELVVPADKVGDFMNSGGGTSQTFNINVSGDVSRQTRKEIVQMLPQIAAGVNSQNKENNYRR